MIGFHNLALLSKISQSDIVVTLILDNLSTAAFNAYSVIRKVRGGYSGPIIRVREGGGDTLLDVGVDENYNLDESAIASHCGANNGYIHTIYDQGTNGYNLIQSTTASQFQIYDGSAVLKDTNGNPRALMDGVDDYMETSSFSAITPQNFHDIYSWYKTANGNTDSIISANSARKRISSTSTDGSYIIQSNGFTTITLTGPTAGNAGIIEVKWITTPSYTFNNNAPKTNGNIGFLDITLLTLGRYNVAGTCQAGYFHEWFGFSSQLSSGDANTLKDDMNSLLSLW